MTETGNITTKFVDNKDDKNLNVNNFTHIIFTESK
jgi:hypothetical protein